MRPTGGRLAGSGIAALLLSSLILGGLLIAAPTAQAATLTGVSVSGPTQRTGVTETYTIQFTTVGAVGAAGDVRIVFPAGYAVTVASVCDIAGVTGETTTVTGQDVVCDLSALSSLGATTAVTITITNVQNPSTAQTTGAFTLETRTALNAVIDSHTTNTETIASSTLTAVSISAPLQTTGAVETWTVQFNTVTAVGNSGDVRIVFPAGFTVSSGGTSVCDITAPITVLAETTTIGANTVVCNLGGTDLIAAGATVTLTISRIANPSTVQTTPAFTIQTRDSSDAIHDEHLTDTEAVTANTPGSVAFSAPNQRAGEVETWTSAFTPINALADGADVRIVFPAGFTTSSGAATVCAVAGKTLTTSVASATEVVCTLSGSTIAAAEATSLTLTNVKNPTTVQTTGAFTLQLRSPTDVIQEQHTTNTEAIVANLLSGVAISAPFQTAGTVETWTFAATTVNAVADGGDIRIVFPAGFQTSSGAATVCAASGKTLTTSVASATEVVCTLTGSTLSAAEAFTLTLTNVKNPTTPQTTAAFTVQTRDPSDAVHDQHTANTETINPSPLVGLSVSAPTQRTGVTETWTIAFTTTNPVATGGDIRIVFPTGFSPNVATTACDVAGLTGETTTVVGTTVVCELVLNSLTAGQSVSLTLTNVRNPSTVQTTGAFTIQTRTTLDVAIDQDLVNTEAITASTLSSVSLSAPGQLTGAIETWTVQFTTVTAVAALGDIRIVFPAGYTLSSGGTSACDVTAPLTVVAETTSVAGSTVVCTLGAADSILAATVVTLTISLVRNPSTVQTTPAFTIQTRDASDAVHDEHLANVEAISANAPAAFSISAPTQLAGAVETWTIAITPVNALADGADVRIVFPSGYATSSGAATVCAAAGKTLTTSVASATEVVCTLSGSTVAAAEAISLTLSNVKNPTNAQTTAAFTVQLRDPTDVLQEAHTSNTEAIAANALSGVAATAPLQTAGSVETWTILFTTFNAVADAGDVRIVFPAGFTTSSGAATVCAIAGKTVTTSVASSTEVVCTLAGSSLSAAEALTVTLTNIKDPTNAQTTGAFTLQTRTPADLVHDAHTANNEAITANTLAAVAASAPLQTAGAVETWTFLFTTVNAVADTGDVRIVFPTGYATSSGAASVCAATGKTLTTVVASTTEVVCTLAGSTLAAAESVSLTVTNVKNPTSVQTTGAFTIQTRTPADAVHDQHLTNTESIVVATLAAPAISAPLQRVGSVETWTFAFTPAIAMADGADVRIVFPAGFTTSSGSATVCAIAAKTLTTSVASTTEVVCTLAGSTIAAAEAVSLTLTNVKNPSSAQTTGAFTLQTRAPTTDALQEQSTTNTETISASTLTSFSASAPLQQAGRVETWTISFTTVNAFATGGDLRIVFPTGFQTSSGAATVCDVASKTTETTTVVSATEIVCELNAASLLAGEALSLTLTNIRNPTGVQTTGAFTVEVRDATDVGLDLHNSNTESIVVGSLPVFSASGATNRYSATETWTFSLQTSSAIAAGGDVRIVFPSGFQTSNGAASLCDISGKTGETTTVASATEIVCELATNSLAAGESITFTITNIRNPTTVLTTGAFTVQTRSPADAIQDQHTTLTVAIVAGAISGVAFSAPLQTTGAVETWTATFIAGNVLGAGGDLRIVFPAGFQTSSGAATVCDAAGKTGETTTVVSATEVVCNFASFGLNPAETLSVTFTNLKNPTTARTTGTFTLQVRDSSDAVQEQNLLNTEAIAAHAFGVAPTLALSNQDAAKPADYVLNLTTFNAWPATGKLVITLPAGYSLASALTINAAFTNAGGGSFVASAAGQTLTLTRQGASELPSGTRLTLTVQGLTNPDLASVGAFTISVTDAADAVIETGTIAGLSFVGASVAPIGAPPVVVPTPEPTPEPSPSSTDPSATSPQASRIPIRLAPGPELGLLVAALGFAAFVAARRRVA
jgi:ribosomal protein L22